MLYLSFQPVLLKLNVRPLLPGTVPIVVVIVLMALADVPDFNCTFVIIIKFCTMEHFLNFFVVERNRKMTCNLISYYSYITKCDTSTKLGQLKLIDRFSSPPAPLKSFRPNFFYFEKFTISGFCSFSLPVTVDNFVSLITSCFKFWFLHFFVCLIRYTCIYMIEPYYYTCIYEEHVTRAFHI